MRRLFLEMIYRVFLVHLPRLDVFIVIEFFSKIKIKLKCFFYHLSFISSVTRFNPNWFAWCYRGRQVATKVDDGTGFFSYFNLRPCKCTRIRLEWQI